jgi:hypothetical protein
MAYSGGIAAAAAAEKRRRALLAEEEEVTQYTQDDLENDWEFKIVRANTPIFRNPKALDKLIEEETRAGWSMLEKLDDSRIRFKRPRSARAKDAYLAGGVDPYRTQYGPSIPQRSLLAGMVGLGLVALVVFGLYRAGNTDGPPPAPVLIPVALVVLVLLAIVAARSARNR